MADPPVTTCSVVSGRTRSFSPLVAALVNRVGGPQGVVVLVQSVASLDGGELVDHRGRGVGVGPVAGGEDLM